MLRGTQKNSESLCKVDSLPSHLAVEQRVELMELIREFPQLFGDVPSCTTWIEHDIDVGGAPPIRQRFYRMSPEKLSHLDSEVQYMLQNNIAITSMSSWASPCALVPKPYNSPRFCTDITNVNAVTKSDSFPLPRIDDCVDSVGSAKFVSKFALLKGYWQVPLSKRQKHCFFCDPFRSLFLHGDSLRVKKCSSHFSVVDEPGCTGVRRLLGVLG